MRPSRSVSAVMMPASAPRPRPARTGRVASSSLNPWSAVSGVRSSCEAMATNSDFMRSISTTCRVAAVTFSASSSANRRWRAASRAFSSARPTWAASAGERAPLVGAGCRPRARPRARRPAPPRRRAAPRSSGAAGPGRRPSGTKSGSPPASTRGHRASPRTTLAAARHRQPVAVLHDQADRVGVEPRLPGRRAAGRARSRAACRRRARAARRAASRSARAAGRGVRAPASDAGRPRRAAARRSAALERPAGVGPRARARRARTARSSSTAASAPATPPPAAPKRSAASTTGNVSRHGASSEAGSALDAATARTVIAGSASATRPRCPLSPTPGADTHRRRRPRRASAGHQAAGARQSSQQLTDSEQRQVEGAPAAISSARGSSGSTR